jgi:antitoxin (DNA-binding transcriptional repressor) of toxin-antitoxin stability system
MKLVSMRDFQRNAAKYIGDLPITLTNHNIPVAKVIPVSSRSMEVVPLKVAIETTSPDTITEDDINQIAENYKVSVSYVMFELEQLKNYCASHGKKYKDYKAALRNFVLRDMKQRMEGRINQNARPAVDARGLSK